MENIENKNYQLSIVNYQLNHANCRFKYSVALMPRKSLSIAVHPDKSVVVKAPLGSTSALIAAKVKQKARWIKRQIAYFDQFDPRTPARKYVGGESHLYLGRKYRLQIELGAGDKVLLKNGYFCIAATCDQPEHIKRLMQSWYRSRAEIILAKIFADCWQGFARAGLSKPSLQIKSLAKRWGSLSRSGRLSLNVNLVQTPKECIEYVVIHELCHLIHHNHSADFYQLLERTMPDWPRRKHKLEMALA